MWWTESTKNVKKKVNTCDELTQLKTWSKTETQFSRCLLPLYFVRNNSNQWLPEGPNWNISAPGLPKYIIVYFGTNSSGENFFPGYPNRLVWVPINPISAEWYTKPTKVGGNFEEHRQTILPLRLCWYWKIWKAQGQTIWVNSVYI